MTDPTDLAARVDGLYGFYEARDFDAAGALMTPEITYTMPQTGERVVGREDYLQFNRDYPRDWHLSVLRVVVHQRGAAAWVQARVGAEISDNVAFLTFDGAGLIDSIVDFWPDPYAPPQDRPGYVERLG